MDRPRWIPGEVLACVGEKSDALDAREGNMTLSGMSRGSEPVQTALTLSLSNCTWAATVETFDWDGVA